MQPERQFHTIPPVFDENARVLILGSFPSVKSREAAFYYGHPQNRFWRVMAAALGCGVPETIPEKKQMLLSRGVALWDVAASCVVLGSRDDTIAQVQPNDIEMILRAAPIECIFTNGGKAHALYRRYCKDLGRDALPLPSTSPANAAWPLERLCAAWSDALRPALDSINLKGETQK